MKKKVLCLFVLGMLLLSASFNKNPKEKTEEIEFIIENIYQFKITDYCVTINDKQFINKIDSLLGKNFEVYDKEKIPSEAIDNDRDGSINELVLLCNLEAGESRTFKVKRVDEKISTVKMTQAELSVKEGGEWVELTKNNGNKQFEYQGGEFKNIDFLKVPEQHTDLTFDIRYEGPGWESDKVAYRFYLDWRNAVDIYGKKVDTVVLQQVGLNNFDSYHEMADWGVDILKVGNSLGIGSIGYWVDNKANRVAETDNVTCKISLNGDLKSQIITDYYSWKAGKTNTHLTSTLSILAGSRLTKTELSIDPALDNICTGIVKHKQGQLLKPEDKNQGWSYMATYGKQTLSDDNVGMAVFYNSSQLINLTEDEYSHVVVLKPENNRLTYYFAAAWEKEKEGIKSLEEFKEYLSQIVTQLDTPVKVSYK